MFLKFFHNISPEYLKLHFTRVSSVQKYSTRGSSLCFAVPKSKGQARFTFYNTAIHHWNALPNEIKNTNDFKGSRTGHSDKVSLWYASLLTNTRFRYLYKNRISSCQAHLMLH